MSDLVIDILEYIPGFVSIRLTICYLKSDDEIDFVRADWCHVKNEKVIAV